jgi:hypothetical protein
VDSAVGTAGDEEGVVAGPNCRWTGGWVSAIVLLAVAPATQAAPETSGAVLVGLRRGPVARNGRLALHPPDLAGDGDVFRCPCILQSDGMRKGVAAKPASKRLL